jgi:integrase
LSHGAAPCRLSFFSEPCSLICYSEPRRSIGFVAGALEEGKYSPPSIRKRSGILRALTGWALVELELKGASNPFKRLGIVKPIGQRDAGLSFTYAEVRKLLSETHRLNDDLRDIIRLLACTGARLAEISGLEIQDIDLQEMTINIRFNATRRLKNNQSVRTVPVVDERSIRSSDGSGLLARGLPMLSFRDTGEKEGRTVRRPRSANG